MSLSDILFSFQTITAITIILTMFALYVLRRKSYNLFFAQLLSPIFFLALSIAMVYKISQQTISISHLSKLDNACLEITRRQDNEISAMWEYVLRQKSYIDRVVQVECCEQHLRGYQELVDGVHDVLGSEHLMLGFEAMEYAAAQRRNSK